jgi:hypothetical protein
MDIFTRVIDGTLLYHGTDNQAATKTAWKFRGNSPMWFAQTEEVARMYGSHILTFQNQRPLMLLDLSHSTFVEDFTNRVIRAYPKSEDRYRILTPLGVPDLNGQLRWGVSTSVGMYNTPGNEKELKIKQYINDNVGFFGDRHRCSRYVDNVNQDSYMAAALKELYPSHHGYICPVHWPSFHHGGALTPEICIFKPESLCTQVNIKQGGGNKRKKKPKMIEKDGYRRYYDEEQGIWIALYPSRTYTPVGLPPWGRSV